MISILKDDHIVQNKEFGENEREGYDAEAEHENG